MQHTHKKISPVQDLDCLSDYREKFGKEPPKILLLINGCRDFDLLGRTLRQISDRIVEMVDEITIFDDYDEADVFKFYSAIKDTPTSQKLRFYRTPKLYDYGDNLKVGFDYALEKGFDWIVILRADGKYDPAHLPSLFWTALDQDSPVVLACRETHENPKNLFSEFSFKTVGSVLLSRIEEMILRMQQKDYHCGYRLYKTETLQRIPYHLNSSDYLFDLQLLIQIRSLGVKIANASVSDFHDTDMPLTQMISYAVKAVGTVLGYRLHQLHLTRQGRYFVDRDEKYTLKKNRYSSHMQIINAIRPGSLVLDLGCGQGLLAEDYAKRDIRVVGVDNIPPSKGIDSFQNYFQQNLEAGLNLPYDRDFDCIILSDVIEHVNDRDKLMKYIRRYLKKEGLLIISTPNIAIWFYRLSLLLGRFEYGPKGILDRTHVHLYTLDSFSRFLRESGYRIISTLYTPIPFELVFSSTGRSLFIDKITHWYHKLALFWPRMFAYQFLLKCQFISYESARDEELLQLGNDKM